MAVPATSAAATETTEVKAAGEHLVTVALKINARSRRLTVNPQVTLLDARS